MRMKLKVFETFFFNASIATVNGGRISKSIARYSSRTYLLQVYLNEDSALVWAAMRKALHCDQHGLFAALLYIDGAYNEMLIMPRSEDHFSWRDALFSTA